MLDAWITQLKKHPYERRESTKEWDCADHLLFQIPSNTFCYSFLCFHPIHLEQIEKILQKETWGPYPEWQDCFSCGC